ncbi:Structural constituent of cell wall [Ceratobasidium theobromae]|uniref:Structural constituent of cell wall n=1 Tax=Ceratobasidium theobromae TaxID=1582974 RepID=A0A5N5QUL1_9AGAM|nr:Structural constituent of cell wall [Ceratobasidium theobromae]
MSVLTNVGDRGGPTTWHFWNIKDADHLRVHHHHTMPLPIEQPLASVSALRAKFENQSRRASLKAQPRRQSSQPSLGPISPTKLTPRPSTINLKKSPPARSTILPNDGATGDGAKNGSEAANGSSTAVQSTEPAIPALASKSQPESDPVSQPEQAEDTPAPTSPSAPSTPAKQPSLAARGKAVLATKKLASNIKPQQVTPAPAPAPVTRSRLPPVPKVSAAKTPSKANPAAATSPEPKPKPASTSGTRTPSRVKTPSAASARSKTPSVPTASSLARTRVAVRPAAPSSAGAARRATTTTTTATAKPATTTRTTATKPAAASTTKPAVVKSTTTVPKAPAKSITTTKPVAPKSAATTGPARKAAVPPRPGATTTKPRVGLAGAGKTVKAAAAAGAAAGVAVAVAQEDEPTEVAPTSDVNLEVQAPVTDDLAKADQPSEAEGNASSAQEAAEATEKAPTPVEDFTPIDVDEPTTPAEGTLTPLEAEETAVLVEDDEEVAPAEDEPAGDVVEATENGAIAEGSIPESEGEDIVQEASAAPSEAAPETEEVVEAEAVSEPEPELELEHSAEPGVPTDEPETPAALVDETGDSAVGTPIEDLGHDGIVDAPAHSIVKEAKPAVDVVVEVKANPEPELAKDKEATESS